MTYNISNNRKKSKLISILFPLNLPSPPPPNPSSANHIAHNPNSATTTTAAAIEETTVTIDAFDLFSSSSP